MLRRVHDVCVRPIGRHGSGPAADFDEFFVDEQPKMVAVALAMTGVPEVARDLAQDALLEAALRWDTVAALDRPGAWLRRVTVNKAISWQRREARRRLAVSKLRSTTVDPPSEPEEAFWEAVRALPPRQRTAIVLRYVDDASTADVAAAMDVTDGTVKATLAAARRTLARALVVDDEPADELGGGRS